MELWDIALRLCAATVLGGAIGLNRDLHGKPTGVRTLGLVALGSALVVMIIAEAGTGPRGSADAVSRVVQGIITGIGFLGAGVILHDTEGSRVHGLTTAACIWLTAGIGLACGIGTWQILLVAVPLVLVLLTAGGPIERAIHRRLRKPPDGGAELP